MKRLTPEIHRRIKAMLASGESRKAIANMTGVGVWTVDKVANNRHQLTSFIDDRRVATLGPRKKGGGADPTPDEIEDACLKIRRARMPSDDDGWLPPGALRPLAVMG